MIPRLLALLDGSGVQRALIVVVTALVFANALDNGFHLDDYARVVNNPEIRQFWPPWRHFVDPSTSATLPRIVQYRPLLPLSLSIDHAIFGLDRAFLRLFAILFHALSALLVYAITRRLLAPAREGPPASAKPAPSSLDPSRTALVIALLFAVHPVSANPVNYICARDLLLTVLFMLLATWCYLQARNSRDETRSAGERRRHLWYGAALLAHALALSAKQNAVALPLLLLALEYTAFGASRRAVGPWLRTLPFFALSVGFFLLTEYVLGFSDLTQLSPDRPVSPFGYALSQVELHLTYYLRNMVWPFMMRQDPNPTLPSSVAAPGVLAGGVAILATLGVALYNLRRRPLLAFAILAYWILLAPTSSVVPMRRAVVDYRPYPSLAFALIAVAPVIGAWLTPRLRVVATLGVLGYFTVSTIWFNTVWRDERTLWEHAVARGAGTLAHHNLAMALKRDLPRREQLLRRSLELAPGNLKSKINLGRTLIARGKGSEGFALLRQAQRDAPHLAQIHFWIGQSLVERDRPREAMPHLLRAARMEPRTPLYQRQAALIVLVLQGCGPAQPWLQRALTVVPNDAAIRGALERCRAASGGQL